MPRISARRLTDAVAKQAPAKDKIYEIVELGGLALRISPLGKKIWAWRFRNADGYQRRLSLGEYPAMPLAEARAKLAEATLELMRGGDPAASAMAGKKAEREAESVAELAEVYMRRHGSKLRTAKEEERRIRRDVLPVIGRRKVKDVARKDIADLCHDIAERIRSERGTSGVHANRVFGTLQRLFGKAVEWGWVDASPCDRARRPIEEEPKRERVLDHAEIVQLWPALNVLDQRMTLALRIMLVTGQRLGEIVRARLHDLAVGTWVIPAEHAKNKRQHLVPLSPLAARLFTEAVQVTADGEWVFPSIRGEARVPHLRRDSTDQALRRLVRRIGMTPVVPHDFRRTAATGMAALKVDPHVIEAVLNHRSGVISGVAAVYNLHTYETEKRSALEAWAARIEELCDIPSTGAQLTMLRLA